MLKQAQPVPLKLLLNPLLLLLPLYMLLLS
jgi:hypothetical protein